MSRYRKSLPPRGRGTAHGGGRSLCKNSKRPCKPQGLFLFANLVFFRTRVIFFVDFEQDFIYYFVLYRWYSIPLMAPTLGGGQSGKSRGISCWEKSSSRTAVSGSGTLKTGFGEGRIGSAGGVCFSTGTATGLEMGEGGILPFAKSLL